MKFTKYNSIANSYNQEFVDKCVAALPNGLDTMCQVTEKIHGANFSFHIDKDEIRVASRNQFVDAGFYGCGDIVEKYTGIMRDIFDTHADDQLIVYGELAGSGVLSGVDYGDKDFYVFDMKLDGSFGCPKDIKRVCDKHYLNHVPILADSCSLEYALNISPSFKSCGNGKDWAEGIVIKPIDPTFLSGGPRIIFKKKSDKFVEKKAREVIPVEPLGDSDMLLMDDISDYITHNRLMNVISHHGTPKLDEFRKLLYLFISDIKLAYDDDGNGDIDFQMYDCKQVNKEITKYAVQLIRGDKGENWKKICSTGDKTND